MILFKSQLPQWLQRSVGGRGRGWGTRGASAGSVGQAAGVLVGAREGRQRRLLHYTCCFLPFI